MVTALTIDPRPFEAAPVGGKEPLRKELHARIQDFFIGGGVYARRGKMIQRDFSNNDAIYDRGGPTFFQGGGSNFFQGGGGGSNFFQGGGPTFSRGGGPTFSRGGGVQLFPGGGGSNFFQGGSKC